jgi:hypothetical protein
MIPNKKYLNSKMLISSRSTILYKAYLHLSSFEIVTIFKNILGFTALFKNIVGPSVSCLNDLLLQLTRFLKTCISLQYRAKNNFWHNMHVHVGILCY